MSKNFESATLRSSTIVNNRKKKGLKVYNGGLGANPLKQHSSLIKCLKYNADKKEYLPPTGLVDLNKLINQRFNSQYSLIGNGLKELIFTLLLGWEEDVYLVTPCWVSYIEQTKILNKKTYFIKTNVNNNYKLTAELLEKNVQNNYNNKILFLNNPTNPTGAVYSKEELIQIADICLKYDITVFADEIYMDIVHDNFKTVPFNTLYDKTITGSSLSKNFGCGGYRLGWITFSKSLEKLYNKLHIIASSTYSCASHCLQYVAYQALLYSPEVNKFIDTQKFIFSNIGITVMNQFKNLGIITSTPQGAWYIFLDFSNFVSKFKKNNINNDQELCTKLIEDIGFVTVPGSSFGYNENFNLRYSFVDLYFHNENNCIDNLNYKQVDVAKMSFKIIDGINQLGLWLNNIF